MIETILPKSSILQKYIDCFYLFNSDKPDLLSYIAFPHTNTGVSFLKGVSVERGDFRVAIKGSTQHDCCIEMLGKYTHPVFVTLEGGINEVAIIFKPLGINRFIREDFSAIAPEYSQPFTNETWLNAAADMFSATDKIAYLENFLLSVLSEKENYGKMEKALAMFESRVTDFSVADVAEELGLNLKTFQRTFTKAMACSPSDYKRIARFRNSLNSRLNSKGLKSLTSISYENNYSDQSYFIKEFRKLTKQNPRHFFKEISLIDGDKIIWEIL